MPLFLCANNGQRQQQQQRPHLDAAFSTVILTGQRWQIRTEFNSFQCCCCWNYQCCGVVSAQTSPHPPNTLVKHALSQPRATAARSQHPLQKCSAPVPKEPRAARRSCQMLSEHCRDRVGQRRRRHLALPRSSSSCVHPSPHPLCCTSALRTCPSGLARASRAWTTRWSVRAHAAACTRATVVRHPCLLSATCDWWRGKPLAQG